MIMGKSKKKPLSAERVAALKRVADAKSDQEKNVATQALKVLKFKEIGSRRVSKAIATLEAVADLANKSAYVWDDKQSEKILKALQAQLDIIKERFAGKASVESKFSL